MAFGFHFSDRKLSRAVTRTVAAAVVVCALVWCGVRAYRAWRTSRLPVGDPKKVLVTAYCNCGKCCGWKNSWFGFGPPVYNYGRLKGAPKVVGKTASGSMAHRGTIAADLSVYPMGTRLDVPGYGTGVVEDVGGSINGRHIDVWFPTHREALKWGARWLDVRVRK